MERKHRRKIYHKRYATGPQKNPSLNLNKNSTVNNVNKLSHIKIVYTNIDGIRNKTLEFSELIRDEKPHVVFLTESKLCPNDLSADYFKIKNYTAYRRDREIQDGGGGVVILVHQDFHSDSISGDYWQNTESIACKLQYGPKNLILGCIYRPPSSLADYNSRVDKVIDNLCQYEVDQYLICGDFNYPKIDWNNNLVNAALDSK